MSVCVCVCMCFFMYVFVYVYVCICRYACVCVCVCFYQVIKLKLKFNKGGGLSTFSSPPLVPLEASNGRSRWSLYKLKCLGGLIFFQQLFFLKGKYTTHQNSFQPYQCKIGMQHCCFYIRIIVTVPFVATLLKGHFVVFLQQILIGYFRLG